jgi:sugar/nucleoside kinase (ribokinase family)
MTFPDPNSPGGRADWDAIYRRVMPYVDIFSPSIEELLFTLRRAEYERLSHSTGGLLANISPDMLSELSAELIKMGTRIVMIKTGERGAYLRTSNAERLAGMGRAAPTDLSIWANQEFWTPCFQVKVVGTTGSGDATIAGFLSALLRDFNPCQAMTAAVAVGACNVEAADALGGIRPWDATMERIAQGWARYIPAPLSAPGWEWDNQDQILVKR